LPWCSKGRPGRWDVWRVVAKRAKSVRGERPIVTGGPRASAG